MMTDQVSDMLTRIRNAGRAGHAEVRCPASRLLLGVARVLVEEGYLDAVDEVRGESARPELVIRLREGKGGGTIIDGLRRVSRPSRRVYVGVREIPRVRNGLGIAVLSTPRGVLSGAIARVKNVGGEVLCEVW